MPSFTKHESDQAYRCGIVHGRDLYARRGTHLNLFFCEGRQLLAKVVMMDMIICIGTCCRPGESVRPAIARTSRAFKLCVEDCWAVLNLSSLEGAWLRCLDMDPRLQPQQLRAVYRAPAVTQPAPKKSRLQWPAKVCSMLRAPFARRARCRPTPSTG